MDPIILTFDSSNKNYEARYEYGLAFAKSQQNWLNDRIQSRGFVTLNDVFEALGYPATSEGATLGWGRGVYAYTRVHIAFCTSRQPDVFLIEIFPPTFILDKISELSGATSQKSHAS